MKDILSEYRLSNLFPQNKTHTHYYEFSQMPHTEIKTMFTDIKDKFKTMNKPMQTTYWRNDG